MVINIKDEIILILRSVDDICNLSEYKCKIIKVSNYVLVNVYIHTYIHNRFFQHSNINFYLYNLVYVYKRISYEYTFRCCRIDKI